MKTILIKIGGSILNEESTILSLCKDIKNISLAGYKIVLVHGGGKAINEALAIYGIESEFIEGLRVTSKEAMKVIEMVLCGQVNQLFVRQLTHIGVKAIGLSGVENQMLLCDVYSKEHGYVGNVKTVNPDFLNHLLKSFNSIPVIATLGIDKSGNALNINADIAASHIANALCVDQLLYLTDQEGIYNKEGKFFKHLSRENLEQLINNSIVSGGMLVKVKAVLTSLRAGLKEIGILNGRQNQILTHAILNKQRVGTLCTL